MKKIFTLMLAIVLAVAAVPAMAAMELTWLQHWEEPGLKVWAQDLTDQFMELYPDVYILNENVGNDAHERMLQMKVAAGDPPIITDLSRYDLYKSFSEAGHLVPLDDMECVDRVNSDMLDAARVNGQLWGITLTQNAVSTAFYNKDVFEQAGVEVPTTYSEWIDCLTKLKEAGFVPIAAPYALPWTIGSSVHAFIYPHCWGADINWPEDKVKLASNFADDENFKKAMTQFFELNEFYQDDPFGTNWEDAQNMVAYGEAAMVINGIWTIQAVLDKNPDCNIGFFPVPTTEDPADTKLPMQAGSGLVLLNDPDPERLAMGKELMNFINTPEAAQQFVEKAMQISAVEGLDYSFSEPLQGIVDYENKLHLSGGHSWVSEYTTPFQDLIAKYLLDGNTDVDAFAVELDAIFSAAAN